MVYRVYVLDVSMAVAASLLGFAFAISTFERWQAKGKRHELAWSVALTMFAIAAVTMVFGAESGWNGILFRLFYLFGAVLNVPFLALGTVYLLKGENFGDRVALILLILGALAAGIILFSPFTGPIPHNTIAQGSKVFGPAPRILAGVGSGLGAIVIVVGAIYSLFRVKVKRLKVSNSLIAIGVLITGASGLLNSVADQMTAFSITLVIGITVIFSGFLVATTPPSKTSKTDQEVRSSA